MSEDKVDLPDFCSIDGKPARDGRETVHAFSPAVSFGLCVFETIRGFRELDGEQVNLFRLDDHLERLKNSANSLAFEQMPPPSTIREWVLEAGHQLSEFGDLHIRIVAYFDNVDGRLMSEGKTRIAIKASPRHHPRLRDNIVTCAISNWRRPSIKVFPGKVKCAANYAINRVELKNARDRDFSNVLVCADDGSIAEGVVASLFAVADDILITPPLECNILEGITRDTILRISCHEKIRTSIERLSEQRLMDADEIFLTSTGKGIEPLLRLEDHNYEIVPGAVTRRISDAYDRLVRSDLIVESSWLTPL